MLSDSSDDDLGARLCRSSTGERERLPIARGANARASSQIAADVEHGQCARIASAAALSMKQPTGPQPAGVRGANVRASSQIAADVDEECSVARAASIANHSVATSSMDIAGIVRASSRIAADAEHRHSEPIARTSVAAALSIKPIGPQPAAASSSSLADVDEECSVARAAASHRARESARANASMDIAATRVAAERQAENTRKQHGVELASVQHENERLVRWIETMTDEICEAQQRFENDGDEGGLADAVTMMVELREEDAVSSDLQEGILKSLQELVMRRRGDAQRKQKWKGTALGCFLGLIFSVAGPKAASLVQQAIGGPKVDTIARWRQEEPQLEMGVSDEVVQHNWDKVVWPTLVSLGLDSCLLGMGA